MAAARAEAGLIASIGGLTTTGRRLISREHPWRYFQLIPLLGHSTYRTPSETWGYAL